MIGAGVTKEMEVLHETIIVARKCHSFAIEPPQLLQRCLQGDAMFLPETLFMKSQLVTLKCA